MKRLFIGIFSIICLISVDSIQAQDKGPEFSKLDVSPMDLAIFRNDSDQPIVRVIYSRPQKREREVFGKLVPYGKVWRTGANEATEITFYQDMMIADKTVKAGTYTLYSIPNEKEWTVILNKKTNTWGAYEYTDQEDIVRITVPARPAPNNIEALSMAFEKASNGVDLLIGWDDTYVKVPFKNAK